MTIDHVCIPDRCVLRFKDGKLFAVFRWDAPKSAKPLFLESK